MPEISGFAIPALGRCPPSVKIRQIALFAFDGKACYDVVTVEDLVLYPFILGIF